MMMMMMMMMMLMMMLMMMMMMMRMRLMMMMMMMMIGNPTIKRLFGKVAEKTNTKTPLGHNLRSVLIK